MDDQGECMLLRPPEMSMKFQRRPFHIVQPQQHLQKSDLRHSHLFERRCDDGGTYSYVHSGGFLGCKLL